MNEPEQYKRVHNPGYKNDPDVPYAPLVIEEWEIGTVRAVTLGGIAVSIQRVTENSFLLHGRGGIKAVQLAGKSSRPRIQRGKSDTTEGG